MSWILAPKDYQTHESIAGVVNVDEYSGGTPFIVESDLQGNSLFEQRSATLNSNTEQLYAGLKAPTLRRFGETTNRKDDPI
jgi:hypothetical protein